MQSRANPRMATLSHYRHNVTRGTTTLIGHITRGPKSELHREVHIPVTKADLTVLRQVIEKLEAGDQA